MGSLKKIVIGLFVALFAVALFLNMGYYANKRAKEVYRDTTRITIIDTIRYYDPTPKEQKSGGTVTDKLALAKLSPSGNGTTKNVPIIEELGRNDKDTIGSLDSAYVSIPITTKVYEDSLYRAVISGYRASLDEILIVPKQEVITIKHKPKRWSVSLQVGYGVALNGTPQFAPFLGVGVSYNLFDF